MTRLVLDGSMTLSWCFEDEAVDACMAVLQAVRTGEAVVPSIWPLEVVNALLVAEKRKRMSAAKSDSFIAELGVLEIQVEEADSNRTFGAVLALARQTGLTSYDASYLELAIRSNLPLASLDAPLRKAARARGVKLIPSD